MRTHTTYRRPTAERRGVTILFTAALAAVGGASPASTTPAAAQEVTVYGVAAVGGAAGRLARPDKPAWVVGDVPDTVWILVEMSVGRDDEDESKTILREAERLAREAVVGNEDNIGRRFALAAVLGMRTDIEGGRTKVGVASDLHDELGVVLELDPEHTRARYMMGRLHAGVRRMGGVTRWLATNLLGGSTLKQATWEEAERHLAFAEEHAPEVPDHHLQLARLYVDTGRPDLAERETRHVLKMSARSPLERVALSEAEELASELGLASR
ncbi:MAG: hypothetical protein HKN72_10670 [Gemmatimonadetes bacterium]|nr:hypothetical protein [Gemmatimonadota bacterium]NNF13681.1 hypothetical protein [Gemmatimonadota bacterium]NNL30772.1 hypothetical protein [Gemmatimonadota bacterium]